MTLTLHNYQAEAVDEIIAEFEAGKQNVILDAPTGSGKTFIASSVLAKYGGLYGAASLDLQRQYKRDFPKVPLVQGHVNHCGEEATEHGMRIEVCPDECGSRDELYTYSQFSLVRHLVRKHGVDLSDPDLSRRCRYAVAKETAIRAPIANINPWLYLKELLGPAEFSARDLMVFDEADQLEGVADLSYADTITVSRLKEHGWELPVDDRGTREMVERDLRAVVADVEREYHAALADLDAALESGDDVRTMRARAERWEERLAHVERITNKAGLVEYVTTWDEERMTVLPVRPGAALEAHAWPHSERRLFMSGSFVGVGRWADWMGLDRVKSALVTVPSQFPAENRPLTIWRGGPNMSSRGFDYPDRVDRLVDAIRTYRNGRTLVHVSSGYQAGVLAEKIPDALTYHTGDARGRAEVLKQYLRWPDSLLIAQSMERGMNLKDDACRTNIIAKMPYPPLGRDVRARKDADVTYYNRQTVASVVQALGRGVRHERDWCNSYILDGAFRQSMEKMLPAHIREGIVN